MATRLLEGQLKAHWKLDSTYGATVGDDSIGSNTLNQGAVASVTGKINEAASFTRASSQYLAIVSNSNLQSLKTFAFWVKFTTISNDMTLIHKGSNATAANSSVWIKYDTNANRIQMQVGNGAGSSETCSTSGYAFAVATWYFVVCRYNTTLNKLSISINGTLNNTSTATLTQYVETGVFYLGRDATGNYLDGALDEVAISQSCLTIAEELTLYNGGSGAQPPYLEGPLGVSGAVGRYPRRLPPSFAEADNGNLYIAYGDEAVLKWDGLKTTFPKSGVPAPTVKPALVGSSDGRIIGDRFAYLRFLDADGRVSNLSPISDKVFVHGAQKAITNATNAAPIVITSAAHGLATGELVVVDGVQGNKAANGLWNVVNVSTNTFSLVTSAGDGEYTGTNSGSVQVTTLQQGAAAVNEVQTITASATPSGGTWTITFNGATTSALAAAATAATVQTAMELLPTIGTGNVTVTGGALGTAAFTMTFVGTLAGANQPAMTADAALLLSANVAISVATLQDGSAGANGVQSFSLYGTPTGGTFTMSFNGQTTAAIAFNSTAAVMQAALELLSTIGAGNILGAGGAFPGIAITMTFQGTLANTNVSQTTINGASLTGGAITLTMSTPTAGAPALSTNNTAWWKMDEASGTRFASVGPRDLTASGTSGSASGILGNAVEFGGGDYLSGAHDSALQPFSGGSFTVAAWVYPKDTVGSIIAIKSGVSGQYSWWLSTVSGKFQIQTSWSDPASGGNNIAWSSAFSINTWYLVVAVLDATANLLKISVNGAAFVTTPAASGGIYVPNTGSLGVGVVVGGVATLNARVDELGLWQSALTAAQVTSLYNAGSGRTTPLASGTNEVQRITIAGTPTQGTFTLTFDAATSAPIAYNATAAQVVTALEAMSTIGTGNVTGANGPLPGTAVNITFTGTLAATDVAAMTANANLLQVSATTTTAGSPSQNEIQRISSDVTPTSGTFTVTFGANTTSAQAHTVTAATLQSQLEGLASIGVGNIAVTGGLLSAGTAFTCTFQGTLANSNQAAMTATSSLLGAVPTLTVATTTDGVAGINEKQQVFTQGTISGGTFNLTLGAATSAAIAVNATAATIQTAVQALSTVGASNATGTGGALNVAPVVLEFVSSKAATNMAEMTTTNTNIVAGGWARGASLITYSNLEAPTDRRVTKRQVLRNKYGNATVFYIDIDTTDLTSTSLTSTNTDDMLGASVALQDSNGNDLNVVRHGEPPNWKRAIGSFQNRIFLAVNHVSRSGELTVTNGSTTVTGEDAFFRTAYATRRLYPQQTDNTKSYNISSVSVPNQTLTAAAAYVGSTVNGLAYGIEAADPDDQAFYFSELDNPEGFNINNGLTITRSEEDGEFVAVIPLINSIIFAFQHRLHRLTFKQSPLSAANGGDGRLVPASWRGVVNNRCWIVAEGKAYILDNRGAYTFNESVAEDLSDQIQPMFQPGSDWSIYWPAREYFHGVYFAENNTMKWYVTLRDGTYPYHAICYHTQRQRWWVEEYPWPVVSSCVGHINGHQVVFLGSTHRRIFVMAADFDAVSAGAQNTVRGTVTSSAAFSLTDSNAAFSTSLTNVPVTIVKGKGAGQQRIIVGSTATKLTLKDQWNIAPDTNSTYQLGGVKWTWKGTQLRLSQKGSESDRGVETTFLPTSRAGTITLRTYADFNSASNKLMSNLSNSDGVSISSESGDVILDLTHTTGFAGFYNDAFFTGRGTHQRYVTVELEGVTNGERQRVSEISIVGVES